MGVPFDLFSRRTNNVAIEFSNADVMCQCDCFRAEKVNMLYEVSVSTNGVCVEVNEDYPVFHQIRLDRLRFQG